MKKKIISILFLLLIFTIIPANSVVSIDLEPKIDFEENPTSIFGVAFIAGIILNPTETITGRINANAVALIYYDRGIIKMNRLINALNVKLHKALRRDDTTFVSRTTLESTRYRPQKIVVLRAVLVNPLTDENVLNEIVSTQNRIGLELWSEFKEVYKKISGESVIPLP